LLFYLHALSLSLQSILLSIFLINQSYYPKSSKIKFFPNVYFSLSLSSYGLLSELIAISFSPVSSQKLQPNYFPDKGTFPNNLILIFKWLTNVSLVFIYDLDSSFVLHMRRYCMKLRAIINTFYCGIFFPL